MIDIPYLRKMAGSEQADPEAFIALIDAYERAIAQVADLTRLLGCAAVSQGLSEIKTQVGQSSSNSLRNYTAGPSNHD